MSRHIADLGPASAGVENALHVPYETLCVDPRGWAKRVKTFLDLPIDAVFENYAAITSPISNETSQSTCLNG
jgi:hypothetical protein